MSSTDFIKQRSFWLPLFFTLLAFAGLITLTVMFDVPGMLAGWLGAVATSLPAIIGVVGICVGTYFVDKSIVGQERARDVDGSLGKYLGVMRAAIVLSAVSFSTTLFGLLDFVGGSAGNLGDRMVGWFISLGTTFGVQFIMLIISLLLGERLLTMRPRLDDAYHTRLNNLGTPRAYDERHIVVRIALGLVIGLCLFIAGAAFGMFDPSQIISATVGLFTGETEGQWGTGVLFVVVAAVIWLVFGAGGNVFGPISIIFLFFVYFGTLFVSSLFSFDSYYGLFNSEDDVEQRRASIVREQTSQYLIDAERSLDALLVDERGGDLVQRIDVKVAGDIDVLVRLARSLDEAFIEEANTQRDQQERRNNRLEAQIIEIRAEIGELEAEIGQARDRALSDLTDAQTLQGDLDRQQSALEAKIQEIAQQVTQRDEIQTEIETNRTLADCEEQGLTEGICEGRSGIPSCGQRCEELRTDADRLEAVNLASAERRLNTLRAEQRALSEDVNRLRLQLQTSQSNVTGEEGAVSPAVQRARAEELRLNAQISRLNDQIDELRNQIAIGGVNEQQTDFDVRSLSTAYSAFKSNPGSDTLEEFVQTCDTTRNTLLSLNATDEALVAFDCQPPEMTSYVQRIERLQAAKQNFTDACVVQSELGGSAARARDLTAPVPAADTNPDSEQPASTAATTAVVAVENENDLATLRTLTNRTRTCITLANQGQEAAREAARQLTEMESIYLNDGADMRRSIEDLRRGNEFAVGAAAAAVFIDLLILVVGLLVAMNRPSMLYDNPLDPNTQLVEDGLNRVAAAHAPDGRTSTGMRIFNNYLEGRYLPSDEQVNSGVEEMYRVTINMDAVKPSHLKLVTAMINALPPRYQRIVDFWSISSGGEGAPEKRTALNQSVVALISRLAYLDADGVTDFEDDDHNSFGTAAQRALETREKAGGADKPTDIKKPGGSSFDDDQDPT